MRLKILAVAAITATVATFGVAAPVNAATTGERITKCGQALTTGKAYLAKNLTCSQGFTIYAPDDGNIAVTLDMRGHRLQGKGIGVAFDVQGQADGSGALLLISNGRVDHWRTALSSFFGEIDANKVKLDHNTVAMSAGKGFATISKSVVSDNTTGTTAFDGAITVDRTLFIHNDTGVASAGGNTARQVILDSVFKSNRYGGWATDVNASLEFRGNKFVGNKVGVLGGSLDRPGDFSVILTENTFSKNKDGIFLNGYAPDIEPITAAEVKSNVAYRNKRYGIFVRLSPGASADQGGNRAWKNGKPCVGVVCSN